MRPLEYIMLVDHDAKSRAFCRGLLESEGYGIIEAEDGAQAFSMIADSEPDIIVLNAAMNNNKGLESARCIKSEPFGRNIAILALTLTEEDIGAAFAAGADDYIIKPLQPRELILRLRALHHAHHERLHLLKSRDMLGQQDWILGILLDLSQSLTGAGNLNRALGQIVSTAKQIFSSSRLALLLPDRDAKELQLAHSTGIDPERAAKIRIPAGKGAVGHVFLSGQTFVANTQEEFQPDAFDSPMLENAPLAVLALASSQRVAGILTISERYENRSFSSLELEYASLLSRISASAIDGIVGNQELGDARDSLVGALAMLAEYRDTDTGKHLDRVAEFATILAKDLQSTERFASLIDDRFLADLDRTVRLHDIGKVAIPDSILLKPDKLTDEESATMKKHAEIGAQAIRSAIQRAPGARFLKMAEDIAHSHHEWYDGAGYPRGLKGEEIPLAARITALADVYDAITTRRPYKKPMSHESAVEIIKKSCGTQFDPAIVEAFFRREQQFRQIAAELADSASEDPQKVDSRAPSPPIPKEPSPGARRSTRLAVPSRSVR